MPNLKTAFTNLDPGFLKIVAEFWSIEDTEIDTEHLIDQLISTMTDPMKFSKMFESLPAQARAAVDELARKNGKISWVDFKRRYGPLMEIGQARLEREKNYLNQGSTTEYLWYRGLLYKAFFEESSEPLEFAYLPDEHMLLRKNRLAQIGPQPFGNPFQPGQWSRMIPANDLILDKTCTLLASLRAKVNLDDQWTPGLPINCMVEMLKAAGIVNDLRQPKTEQTRVFLEADRSKAMRQLFMAWEKSAGLNELWLMPEIKCEGKWRNRPQTARQDMLELIKQIPVGEWWDLESFIAAVHERKADFLRPSGDYDSWIIRNRASGEYLRGFANWDKVEGRLIHSYITQWLHWLGVVDLAEDESRKTIPAFRLSPWAPNIFENKTSPSLAKENEKIILRTNGTIVCSRMTPRSVRYQIARFCDWGKEKNDEYYYYLSAAAVERAEAQQLPIKQLVSLFKKHAKPPIPPAFIKAIQRWEQFRLQARLEHGILLRVTNSAILDELEKTTAKRFLIERVSPLLTLVQPGGEEVIQRTLMELGYLAEKPSSL
jgi:hypothetical protein